MLHGWGGTRASLENLGSELTRELAVDYELNMILFEMPGHGETPIEREMDLNSYCEWFKESTKQANTPNVKGLIDSSKLSPANANSINIFIGHSFGGKILLQLLTEKYFSAQDLLVLINANGLKAKPSRKQRLLLKLTAGIRPLKKIFTRVPFTRILRKIFYKYVVGVRDYEKTAKNPILRQTFLNVISENINEIKLEDMNKAEFAANMPKIKLIWGGKDTQTPLWMGKKLNSLLKSSTIEVFPDATHGLPLHAPKEVARVVSKFIRQNI